MEKDWLMYLVAEVDPKIHYPSIMDAFGPILAASSDEKYALKFMEHWLEMPENQAKALIVFPVPTYIYKNFYKDIAP